MGGGRSAIRRRDSMALTRRSERYLADLRFWRWANVLAWIGEHLEEPVSR